jgi:hypothetical protein
MLRGLLPAEYAGSFAVQQPRAGIRRGTLFFACLNFLQGCRKSSDPFVRPNKPQANDQMLVALFACFLARQLTHGGLPMRSGANRATERECNPGAVTTEPHKKAPQAGKANGAKVGCSTRCVFAHPAWDGKGIAAGPAPIDAD